MEINKRRVKLTFIFLLIGTGIFTLQVYLPNYSLSYDRSTPSEISVNIYSRTVNCETGTPKAAQSAKQIHETKYLKLPLQNSSCFLNPCDDNQKSVADVKWKMVFVIKSAASHATAREILRRTWASVSYIAGYQFIFVFVVGKTDTLKQQALIDEEYERYGDILQIQIPDEYRFIAQKTLGGMQWATNYFRDDVFYTSCDDDFMINMAGLVEVMQWHQEKVKEEDWGDFPIICTYSSRISDYPIRDNQSKYYITKTEYKWAYYPDYCLGGAYTTSVGVVRQLLEASWGEVPLKMDDVWITGILRQKMGMPRQLIRKLDAPLATHHLGFSSAIQQNRREQMQKEWKSLQEKFANLEFCKCSGS